MKEEKRCFVKKTIYVAFLLVFLLATCAASVPQFPSGSLSAWNGEFRWQGVDGATWYLLEVYTDTGTQVYRKWHEMTCVDCSIVTSLSAGAYGWQVLDWGVYGYGTWTKRIPFSFEQIETPIPPPVVWHVPTDGTFAQAMAAMTDCGTVYVEANLAEPAISYGESRSASYIIPDYGCDWQIIGNRNIVTYDPSAPPMYYDGPGVLMLIKSTGTTTVEGLHFVGTMALGDNIDPSTGGPVDKDICLLLDAAGNMTVRGNEFERCGHAGIKSYYPGEILLEYNRCHDIGFTSRDHCVYISNSPATIRNNQAWDISGGGFGLDTAHVITGGLVEWNVVVDSGYGIWSGWGSGHVIRNNFAINSKYYDLGIFGGGHTFENNTFGTIYSERSCGAIVTNWCASPVPNVFYDMGNLYETVSHPERIE